MTSIENKVIDTVTTALVSAYQGISVYSDTVAAPESFPCVTIWEADSYVANKFVTTNKIENATDVMYEINVYTTGNGAKKTTAKNIANSIDGLMALMGFTRTSCMPTPNADRNVYRITMQYTGRVTEKAVGNNTYYTIYGKD